ncbi:MAG: polysaccharide deacetylase family protein [Chloroflexota bacterium]
MSCVPKIKATGLIGLLVILLAGCTAPAASPTPTVVPTATVSPTPLPTSTSTPTLTPTPIRTPPALADLFQTSLLNPLDPPHTYIQDTCQYLHDKWSSTNSAPGTVVMVIMFHSITKGEVTRQDQISEKQFTDFMSGLSNRGFEAITTTQLADFMERNAKIPPRSVLLVVDDRHGAEYFNKLFRQFWEADKWPVVNAYISASRDNLDAANWLEQEALNAEGWVDYQAHGVVHNTPMWPGVSDAYITSELQGSIDAFKLHFNKTPIAIIWPGGGFSVRSVEVARQLGYRLGFTTSPRGPLMFDWVPLSDANDPQRPSWVPEGSVNDPLLVLPRYWDTDAILHIDDVVKISQEAAAYTEQNKATELEYYGIVCASSYGALP